MNKMLETIKKYHFTALTIVALFSGMTALAAPVIGAL
jgi:hypothetical protein